MAQATKRDKKSTKGEAGGEGDAVLHEDALATLERMKAVDPGLKKLLKNHEVPEDEDVEGPVEIPVEGAAD